MSPRLSYADVSNSGRRDSIPAPNAGVGFSVFSRCQDFWNLIARELIEVRSLANRSESETGSMGMVLGGSRPFEVACSAVRLVAALVVYLKKVVVVRGRWCWQERTGHQPMQQSKLLLSVSAQENLQVPVSGSRGGHDAAAHDLRHSRSGRYASWKAANATKVADFVALIKRLYRHRTPNFFRLHEYSDRHRDEMIMSQTLGKQA
jgi:hypothetical protein